MAITDNPKYFRYLQYLHTLILPFLMIIQVAHGQVRSSYPFLCVQQGPGPASRGHDKSYSFLRSFLDEEILVRIQGVSTVPNPEDEVASVLYHAANSTVDAPRS
jgi:hypothetical protein